MIFPRALSELVGILLIGASRIDLGGGITGFGLVQVVLLFVLEKLFNKDIEFFS